MHMALNKIDPHNSRSLHVSFDIDALDPLEAPSTGTPGNCINVSFLLTNSYSNFSICEYLKCKL